MPPVKLFKKGDRVLLLASALRVLYITIRSEYTNMYPGKTGTVIGYSETGKVAVQFDDKVFHMHDIKISSHDNGCHGKGDLHYCWYIEEKHLVKGPSVYITDCTEPMNDGGEEIEVTNNLLLLV